MLDYHLMRQMTADNVSLDSHLVAQLIDMASAYESAIETIKQQHSMLRYYETKMLQMSKCGVI